MLAKYLATPLYVFFLRIALSTQTGNVVASAAIISEEATEVAGIVKIVLNSGLGILVTAIAFWWQTRQTTQTETDEENTGTNTTNKFSLLFLWDSFPKFVLGYIACSTILTIVLPLLEESPEGEALQPAVLSLNKWWFAIG